MCYGNVNLGKKTKNTPIYFAKKFFAHIFFTFYVFFPPRCFNKAVFHQT